MDELAADIDLDDVPRVQRARSRAASEREPVVVVVFWWAATVLTLIVLDDLTFGPLFWVLSRIFGPFAAIAAIYAVYVPAQVFIVNQATLPNPGRTARFFLRRLDLTRRRPEISDREDLVHHRVVGGTSAVVSSLLIAGVLPPLLLWKAGFTRRFVRRISYVTAFVYASEFALLHGFVPSLF